MKQKDVQVNAVYLARVSGDLVKVLVIARVDPPGGGRVKFQLRRVETGHVLFKFRSAAALREVEDGEKSARSTTGPDRIRGRKYGSGDRWGGWGGNS